jgi:hypothetical protein
VDGGYRSRILAGARAASADGESFVNERLREPVFAGAVALALAAGVLIEAAAGDVKAPAPSPLPTSRLAARAVYCAPTGGERPEIRTSAVAAERRPIEVDSGSDVAELAPDRSIGINSESAEPTQLVAYGARIAAGSAVGAESGPVEGTGAVLCSAVASPHWYFAAGSASLGSRERILLYNPFPDEAVVRVNFFTPEGRELRTTFEEVPVPARSWESVDINDAIRVTTAVAVVVNASRGRVVAWRELFANPEQLPSGVQSTIGAMTPAPEWYFPDGALGPGVDERISVLNPSGREAEVTITLSGANETLQARKLMEIAIPRRSSLSIPLEDRVKRPEELTGVSATVTTLNGVDVVAERTVWYETGDISGVASEIGARRPAVRWVLPPASVHPSTDAVTIMNPGAEPVSVALEFLRTNDTPIAPGDLQQIQIRAGARLKLAVGEYTDGRSVPALLTASHPVVAERFSYSSRASDVGSLIGVPLRRLP